MLKFKKKNTFLVAKCLWLIDHSAVFVQGRSAFNRNNQTSKLGVKAFAFMWTASACLFLSCLMYCLGGAVGRKDASGGYSGRKERRRGFFSSARSNSVRSQKKKEEQPTTSYDQPTTTYDQPTTSYAQPTTSYAQPTTSYA